MYTHTQYISHLLVRVIDPHLLVSQEDIIQEDHHKDAVDDTVPQDQPMIIERPTTVFVEQKGINVDVMYESKRKSQTVGHLTFFKHFRG